MLDEGQIHCWDPPTQVPHDSGQAARVDASDWHKPRAALLGQMGLTWIDYEITG